MLSKKHAPMKKLFVKENHTKLWLGAAVIGALAAAGGIWFYLHGRKAAALEAQVAQYAQDYLKSKQKKKKKHKSDVADLGDIVHHQQV